MSLTSSSASRACSRAEISSRSSLAISWMICSICRHSSWRGRSAASTGSICLSTRTRSVRSFSSGRSATDAAVSGGGGGAATRRALRLRGERLRGRAVPNTFMRAASASASERSARRVRAPRSRAPAARDGARSAGTRCTAGTPRLNASSIPRAEIGDDDVRRRAQPLLHQLAAQPALRMSARFSTVSTRSVPVSTLTMWRIARASRTLATSAPSTTTTCARRRPAPGASTPASASAGRSARS